MSARNAPTRRLSARWASISGSPRRILRTGRSNGMNGMFATRTLPAPRPPGAAMLTIDGGPGRRPGGSRNPDVADGVRTVVLNAFPLGGLPPLLMDTRLVGTSLGLDSIDAIELVLALEGEFGVAIDES